MGLRGGLDFLGKRKKSLVLHGNRTTIHKSLSSVNRSKNQRKYIKAELLRISVDGAHSKYCALKC